MLVTGASRPAGIGQAVIEHCAHAGASVAAAACSAYDAELEYADAGSAAGASALARQGIRVNCVNPGPTSAA